MHPDPLPLREILLCQTLQRDTNTLIYAVVLRKGLNFELLQLLRSRNSALIRDNSTLKLLERRFQLPVRVLLSPNGSFLGLKTLLAQRKGTNYSLKPTPTR